MRKGNNSSKSLNDNRIEITRKRFKSPVSDRNILGLEYDNESKLPKKGLTENIYLKICAIRVEFEPDETPHTTGDGLFDLSPREESPYTIDPTPHDYEYFSAHLQALSRYWYSVSNGKIILDYNIYPSDNDGAYRLPDSMSYYSMDSWFTNYNDLLGQLFIDAFNLAYDTDSIRYEDYDVFILFHAGADWQGDIGPLYEWINPDIYVPSTHDLPTSYITFNQPVVRDIISDGMIIPEYISQDGQEGALNGVIAHEFGHQLGLPDLYSTDNFVTQVGDFSLMDNGGAIWVDIPGIGSVRSVLPSYPSAWERAYLGFEDVYTIESDRCCIALNAVEVFEQTGVTIARVNINEFEYFLIENRQDNFGPDSTIFLHQDSLTGVIMGPIYDDYEYNSKYDYLLPASGILIWHIDELVAYQDTLGIGGNNFSNNTLQWNPYRRFIDLEEADGAEDLGFIMTTGEDDDYFFEGGNNTFTPDTRPNTNSNDNGKTHIHITDISRSAETMSFQFTRKLYLTNWMRNAPGNSYSPIVLSDWDNDGLSEIFLSVDNRILAWNADGSNLIENDYNIGLIDFRDDTSWVKIPLFYDFDEELNISPPTIVDITGDTLKEVIVGLSDGSIYLFKSMDENYDGMADILSYTRLDGQFSYPSYIIRRGDGIYLVQVSSEGNYYILSKELEVIKQGDLRGEVVGIQYNENSDALFFLVQRGRGKLYKFNWMSDQPSYTVDLPAGELSPLLAGDLNGNGREDLVFISSEGYVFAYDALTGNALPGFPATFPEPLSYCSTPIVGDMDGDGRNEIIFTAYDKIYAFNDEGYPKNNFEIRTRDIMLASPILTDLQYDSDRVNNSVLVGTIDGYLQAYKNDSNRLPEYKIATGTTIDIAVSDLNSNGREELISLTYEGILYTYTTSFLGRVNSSKGWQMWGKDSEHSFKFDPTVLPSQPLTEKIIRKFYNYPNPTKDRTNIRVELNSAGSFYLFIYDLEGRELFKSQEISKSNAGVYELDYDVSDLPASVLLGKIEVTNQSGKTEEQIIKIAVIKEDR